MSSRSKIMPRALNQTKREILYKAGDILNTKVYVNWIQLLFYNERNFTTYLYIVLNRIFLFNVTAD